MPQLLFVRQYPIYEAATSCPEILVSLTLFPCTDCWRCVGIVRLAPMNDPLTKHEQFAAMALQGLLTKHGCPESDKERREMVEEAIWLANELVLQLRDY